VQEIESLILTDFAFNSLNSHSQGLTPVVHTPIDDSVGLSDFIINSLEKYRDDIYGDLDSKWAYFLYHLIRFQDENENRIELLKKIISNERTLYLSSIVLLNFLEEFGIYRQGAYYPNPEEAKSNRAPDCNLKLYTYDELYAFKDKWLDRVRHCAKNEDLLNSQYGQIYILFHWGELNDNDFSETQQYIIDNLGDKKWLNSFLELFQENGVIKNQRNLRWLIPEDRLEDFIVLVSRSGNRLADQIIDFLNEVVKHNNEKKKVESKLVKDKRS
jgi:hypothetical protein